MSLASMGIRRITWTHGLLAVVALALAVWAAWPATQHLMASGPGGATRTFGIGFVLAPDPDLAWRWSPPGEYSCSSGPCRGVMVATNRNCPDGVLVESGTSAAVAPARWPKEVAYVVLAGSDLADPVLTCLTGPPR